MQRLAQAHSRLTVVSDQIGSPTWTRTLAESMIHLTNTHQVYDTYHTYPMQGKCSWYEFAKEILKDEVNEVAPGTSEKYPQKAHRPKQSIMDLSKAKITGFKIIEWDEALAQFLNSIL